MIKKLFISLLFFVSPILASASDCDFLFKSEDVERVKELLASESRLAPVWGSYQISKKPIVLLKLQESSHCGVLFLEGRLTKLIESESKIELANQVYSFLIDGRSSGNDKIDAIETAMASEGISNAMIWNLDFEWPAQIPEQFQLGIMVHEGFHLFSQRRDPHWPKWPTAKGQLSGQAIRKSLVEKCYNHDQSVQELVRREFRYLMDSTSFSRGGQFTEASGSLRKFSDTRIERYQKLKGVTVTLSPAQSMSCQDLEASFEMMEGTPEFPSYHAVLMTGVLTEDELFRIIEMNYGPSTQKETYYAFGGLQLLSLSLLSGDFGRVQKRLLGSLGPQGGIFIEVQRYLIDKE